VKNQDLGYLIVQDYTELAKETIVAGEPGYFWLDNCGTRINPCLEISLENKDIDFMENDLRNPNEWM